MAVGLRELVRGCLSPQHTCSSERLRIDGPEVSLDQRTSVGLAPHLNERGSYVPEAPRPQDSNRYDGAGGHSGRRQASLI
jgi:hypothetical protein